METGIKDFNREFDRMKEKYISAIPDKILWNSEDVSVFFDKNRKTISKFLLEYPRFRFKNVQILAGLCLGKRNNIGTIKNQNKSKRRR